MSEFCFKNLSNESNDESCIYINNDKDIPVVEINNRNMIISFGSRVISKTFSGYFGSIQDYVKVKDIKTIAIDFRQTEYINLFCISKIIL